MRDENLVQQILEAVVRAVDVPVTLKTRLGWSRDEMNAVNIARIAEDAGIKLVTIHGRTRADKFQGSADYEGIAAVKCAVSIPVLANGDITSPEAAARVLQVTGADGVMVGRAAQGRPWLPAQIDEFLVRGEYFPDPSASEVAELMARHLASLHHFYGEHQGVRIARKHVGWTLEWLARSELKQEFHRLEEPDAQLHFVRRLQQAA